MRFDSYNQNERKIRGRILVLDFDDVILPSERLIDSYIAKTWYTASDRYIGTLDSDFLNDKIKTRDELKAIKRIAYDKKNQILEEVYPHLKGKIDYCNIIKVQNISRETVEQVRRLISSSRYKMVIIESHYNSLLERQCKEKLIKRVFPGAFFLPVKFFEMDYFRSKDEGIDRVRTNKAEYLNDYLTYNGVSFDFEKVTFVDNSKDNVDPFLQAGAVGILFGNENIGMPSISDLSIEKIINIEEIFDKAREKKVKLK